MERMVQVVDSFYGDPESVRAIALRQDDWMREGPDGEKYDSYETPRSFYTAALVACFEELVGHRIYFDEQQMAFGVFAFYAADEPVDQTTHFDMTDYSAIVYLVPDAECEGGLTFFTHKATGLAGPPTQEELERLGFETLEQFAEEVYFPDKLDPSAWEATTHIAMRFNRLVILRGAQYFHRAASGFGITPSSGRLTHRFFFNESPEGPKVISRPESGVSRSPAAP